MLEVGSEGRVSGRTGTGGRWVRPGTHQELHEPAKPEEHHGVDTQPGAVVGGAARGTAAETSEPEDRGRKVQDVSSIRDDRIEEATYLYRLTAS